MKNNNPVWLKPLWRRVALVAFCGVWSAWEFYNGASGWGAVAGGLGLYGAYLYLYSWEDPADGPSEPAAKE